MVKKFFVAIVNACLIFSNISCATIMQGTTQDVGISSTPSGATVSINNSEKGKTPLVVDLKRKDNHIIKIELAGYQTYETTLTKKTSGWVWGNIVFGGLIGLVVDAMAGGIYRLTPEQIDTVLARSDSAGMLKGKRDIIIIATVLEPDPTWEKIGQLVK